MRACRASCGSTFADFQLGIIDASKNAQKLVAVRFFQTTATYVAGEVVLQGGKLYVANGAVAPGSFTPAQWTQIAAASDITAALASYLPLTGGALTGALALAADPVSAAQAATKNYVDGKFAVAGQGIFLPIAGGTLTGALTLAGDPVGNLQPATKQYALNRNGDTMVGMLTLSGPPTANLHAATKAYVDAGGAVPFLPLAGGTMTGPIVLAADPTAALQPATKQYVDNKGMPVGVTDGSNAAPGQVGEVISQNVTAGLALTTNVALNVTSIPLTPGDWDVGGEVWITLGSAARRRSKLGSPQPAASYRRPARSIRRG